MSNSHRKVRMTKGLKHPEHVMSNSGHTNLEAQKQIIQSMSCQTRDTCKSRSPKANHPAHIMSNSHRKVRIPKDLKHPAHIMSNSKHANPAAQNQSSGSVKLALEMRAPRVHGKNIQPDVKLGACKHPKNKTKTSSIILCQTRIKNAS